MFLRLGQEVYYYSSERVREDCEEHHIYIDSSGEEERIWIQKVDTFHTSYTPIVVKI